MPARAKIPVIDLFAGPGGLGEGFARQGQFKIAISIEKDPIAHKTLRLRAFTRQFPPRALPEEYYAFLKQKLSEDELFRRCPVAAKAAEREAWHCELGVEPHERVRARIGAALRAAGGGECVLIGGPPCQAYSIVGRSRNRGIEDYELEMDDRHRLYEEYLRIVADHWPAVFVMENVPGLLSAAVRTERLFERICDDLQNPGRAAGRRRRSQYRLVALEERRCDGLFDEEDVRRFIVRAENHGVPQCRHRVIIVGIRDDLSGMEPPKLAAPVDDSLIPASAVLSGLPRLRSGFSKRADSKGAWLEELLAQLNSPWVGEAQIELKERLVRTIRTLRKPQKDRGGEFVPGEVSIDYEPGWYLDPRIEGACNHSTRGHIEADLHRYLFAAAFAQVNGRSPDLREFPGDLLPKHENVPKALNGGIFNDRFRVQVANKPSTTITSHISKDGHYYIHYDPSQCRSLTVREAARLQTFPDNYFFRGPRTAQYVQVGNAVPPYLAHQIAGVVSGILEQSGVTA